MLPDIRTFANETPCLAYLCGTNTFDNVRILGIISEDGTVGDVTVHVDGAIVGQLVPEPVW